MSHTASLSDWLAAGSVGLMALGALGFGMAFADADAAYFDPRPAVRRAVESGALDPLLIRVGPALADTRQFAVEAREFARLSLRDAALTVAALLVLLLPATGGTR